MSRKLTNGVALVFEPSWVRPWPWSALTPKLLHHVLRRLSSDADHIRFASVCRHWRHVSRQFRPGWSGLPPHLLGLVVRRLSAKADRVRFASVCRHWSHVARQFSSPWSGLPPELAYLVLRRLYSHADRVRFAAVCRHWRYVARQYSPPLPPALPWLWTKYGEWSLPNGGLHFLRLSVRDWCYGSFGNWLLLKEIGGDHRFLHNPLSGATLSLPTHCTEPVYLYFDGSHETPSNLRSTYFKIHKLIMCTDDLIAAMVSYRYGWKHVVCCRPGRSSWSMGLYNGNRYQDMAFHMGKLSAVADGGDLFVHEVTEGSGTGEPRVSRIDKAIPVPPQLDGYYGVLQSVTRCYLVISVTGKLLLVRWFVPYSWEDRAKNLKLKVFEADFETSLWLEVERLDDQVLFVSSNSSKAMGASTDDDYLQANKIYVVDHDIMFQNFWPKYKSCTCVYNMRSKIIRPISLGERMIGGSQAAWFFP